MDYVIWGGAALTMLGVAGLMWCVVLGVRAKRSGLPDAEVKAQLARVVAINLAALAISALGLMAVIFGVILSA
ncbi:hypothetical protein C0V75_08330 [Tabrizicola sp. TH137]|uniref:hypothetical protein n=1 Tax=Tabrizicola sp. TH137 TaxID=2067452 RepID=UPI000C7A78FC|nr:hypothetical protein [Tabrizicola sp. TH137]PLL13378.1 hypothetical protein C0V75_08330 [Tabrizicola sp. TH137]